MGIDGGVSPYIVALAGGSLPTGLTLAAGAISGTPAQSGRSAFTLEVTDQNGFSFTKRFRIKVVKQIAVRTVRLRNARTGRAYSARLSAIAGQKPFSWSVSAGALPDGFAIEPATGRISGTPANPENANFTVQVVDALGGVDMQALSLIVKP
jgi:hypothetical protein